MVLNAAIGMSAEALEFIEILKKIMFQGKEQKEENKTHLKARVGDILRYIAQACIGLNFGLSEILERNVDKLSAQHPNGFALARCENHEKGGVLFWGRARVVDKIRSGCLKCPVCKGRVKGGVQETPGKMGTA